MFLRPLRTKFDRGVYELHAVRVRSNVEEIASVHKRRLTSKEIGAYLRWRFSPGHTDNFKLADDKAVPENLRWFGLIKTFYLDHLDDLLLEYPAEQGSHSQIYAISKATKDTDIRLELLRASTESSSAVVKAINLSSGAMYVSELEPDCDGLVDAACKVLSAPKRRWRSLEKQIEEFSPVYPMNIDDAQKRILSKEFVDNKAPWSEVVDLSVLEHVLKAGVDPNTLDDIGLSAMHWAWSAESIDLLLSYGADINWYGLNLGTPLDYAQDPKVIGALKDGGALYKHAFRNRDWWNGSIFRAAPTSKNFRSDELHKRVLNLEDHIQFVDAATFDPTDSRARDDLAGRLAWFRAEYNRGVVQYEIYDVRSQEPIGRYHLTKGYQPHENDM